MDAHTSHPRLWTDKAIDSEWVQVLTFIHRALKI